MKKRVAVIGGLVLIGAVWGGHQFWQKKKAAAEPEKYEQAVVERTTLQRIIDSTGTVKPENRLDVKSPVSGRVEELLVDEGDEVEKGRIIGWVSSTERATLLDAARAISEEEAAYWEGLYKPTPLVAPMSGTVIARAFEPGQTIDTKSELLTIANDLMVVALLDETDIGLIRKGVAVEIRLEAYPEQSFAGTVQHLAYDAKMVSNVTMYEIEVAVTQMPAFARSGMTANVNFLIARKEGVLAVPAASVLQRKGKAVVLLPSEIKNEKPEKVVIETGMTDGESVEVVEGLEEGQTVLIPTVKFASKNGKKEKNPFSMRPTRTGGGRRNR
ncbi:efflux RND transporter periplasmic adaptor subunit [Verrucomicrobiota bacterium]